VDVPLAWPGAPLATWLPVVQDLLQTSEFFWLYVPLVLLGLVFAHRSGAVQVGLVWAVTAVLSGSYLAVSATGIFFLLLVGLGIEDFGRWLLAAGRVRPDVSDTQFLWGLGVVALLFVGAAHLGYVWTSYQFRPVVQSSVETVTAVWITDNSQPDETVFASRRVAFLADRPLLPGSVSQIDPLEAGQVIAPLVSQPPDFVVTLRTIGWEFVTQTSWFRDRYRSRQRFASPLATNTPIDVWTYEPSLFDRGKPGRFR
jgi:hypothetical protein